MRRTHIVLAHLFPALLGMLGATVGLAAAGRAPWDTHVTIVAPINGSTVSDGVVVSAVADDKGVTSLQFLVDGMPLGSPITAGTSCQRSLDTKTLTDGPHTLDATAVGDVGAVVTVTPSTVIVKNAVTPPPPPPAPVQDSPNCTKGSTIVIGGVTFALQPDGLILKDGATTNGRGTVLKAVDGALYTAAKIDPPNWYKYAGTTWLLAGTTEPACGVVTPPPTPASTTTLDDVVHAVQNGFAAIVALLNPPAPPAPLKTVNGVVTTLGDYANGDQKVTIRIPKSGIVVGQTLPIVIK